MANLDGWKRTGIIVSVVWILGAGLSTYINEENSKYVYGEMDQRWCLESGKEFAECHKQMEDYIANHPTYGELIASESVFALIPVPLGWGLTYLILFIVAWVKRGFMRPL